MDSIIYYVNFRQNGKINDSSPSNLTISDEDLDSSVLEFEKNIEILSDPTVYDHEEIIGSNQDEEEEFNPLLHIELYAHNSCNSLVKIR